MNDKRGSTSRLRDADVSRPPFMAGVVLTIAALVTFVFGLYTLKNWSGPVFLALGVLTAIAGLTLVFNIAWARPAAVVAALVSVGFSAVWVPVHFWFAMAIIFLDALAVFAIFWGARLPTR